MFGNRGIYQKGWTAGDAAQDAGVGLLVGETVPALRRRRVGAYDTNTDWSQAKNLAKEMPDKLHYLQRLWLIEATRYNVLPIDDRVAERMKPGHGGPPRPDQGQDPGALRRHGPLVGKLGGERQEQVTFRDRRNRGCRRPGRRASSSPREATSAVGPVCQGRQAE